MNLSNIHSFSGRCERVGQSVHRYQHRACAQSVGSGYSLEMGQELATARIARLALDNVQRVVQHEHDVKFADKFRCSVADREAAVRVYDANFFAKKSHSIIDGKFEPGSPQEGYRCVPAELPLI